MIFSGHVAVESLETRVTAVGAHVETSSIRGRAECGVSVVRERRFSRGVGWSGPGGGTGSLWLVLRGLAGGQAVSGGGAEFGQQCQRGGATFDRAGFDAVGALAHAVAPAVEDSQRDQAFAGADRDQRRDG